MALDVNELRLAGAILEGHVLQFALAAGIADRAVEGMVGEQDFKRGLARLHHLLGLRLHHHAFGDGRGAGGLHLGHLFDFDQAHAACALERESGVVAEGGNLDAILLAGLNEQGALGSRNRSFRLP